MRLATLHAAAGEHTGEDQGGCGAQVAKQGRHLVAVPLRHFAEWGWGQARADRRGQARLPLAVRGGLQLGPAVGLESRGGRGLAASCPSGLPLLVGKISQPGRPLRDEGRLA